MYYIYLKDNTVLELIPDESAAFPGIPAAQRYSSDFLSHCITLDDVSSIHTGMIYDPDAKTFSEPPIPNPVVITEPTIPEPTEQEQLRADVDYIAAMEGVNL